EEPSGTPFGPGATPGVRIAADKEASPAGPVGGGPGGFRSDGYPPFGYAFDAYPPPGYASTDQTPGSAAPGGYGRAGYPPGYLPGGYGPAVVEEPKRSRRLAAAVAAALVLVGVG